MVVLFNEINQNPSNSLILNGMRLILSPGVMSVFLRGIHQNTRNTLNMRNIQLK